MTNFLSSLSEIMPEYVAEAFIDSIKVVPSLFVLFIVIELAEQFFAKKQYIFRFYMKRLGPVFGSFFATIPQCGFSVIAATLYCRRLVSRGTLLAVYLATSDEAVPLLLTYPSRAKTVLPIILVKLLIALPVGYAVDAFVSFKAKDYSESLKKIEEEIDEEEGCCHHHIMHDEESRLKTYLFHPLIHTLTIFVWIFGFSIILGFIIEAAGTEERLASLFLRNSPIQPLLTAAFGLIPNCAVSVMLTVLFVKNSITFGSLVAGLFASGGLGIIVLLRRNGDKKDCAVIIALLYAVSALAGMLFQYNVLGISTLFEKLF